MKSLVFVLVTCFFVLISSPSTVKSDQVNKISGYTQKPPSFQISSFKLHFEPITTEQLIRQISTSSGFSNWEIDLFVKIAQGESGLRYWAKNPKTPAAGLFAIMPDTWGDNHCKGNVYDEVDNTICAIRIKHSQGWGAWQYYTFFLK